MAKFNVGDEVEVQCLECEGAPRWRKAKIVVRFDGQTPLWRKAKIVVRFDGQTPHSRTKYGQEFQLVEFSDGARGVFEARHIREPHEVFEARRQKAVAESSKAFRTLIEHAIDRHKGWDGCEEDRVPATK